MPVYETHTLTGTFCKYLKWYGKEDYMKPFVYVPESLLYEPVLTCPGAMSVWLFLHLNTLYKSFDFHFRGKQKVYEKGVRPASRSFIKKNLGYEDGVAKNYYNRLNGSGLLSVKLDPEVGLNVVTVNTVNPSPLKMGQYLKLELPFDEDVFYESPKLWVTYLYLFLKAKAEECVSYGGKLLKRGQCLLKVGKIADKLGICLTEMKELLNTLREYKAITTEKLANDGLVFTMPLYPEKVEYTDVVKVESQVEKQEPVSSVENAITTVVEVPTGSSPTPSMDDPEIVQKPITEAVKRYFFGRLHGTKDVNVLNKVILELSDKIASKPLPCNVEKYIDGAMDEYLKLHESDYPSANSIYKFLVPYYEKYRKEAEEESERIYQEKLAQRDKQNRDNFHIWAFCTERVYEEYKKTGYLPHKLTPQHLWAIRWVLKEHSNTQFYSYTVYRKKLEDYADIGDTDIKSRPDTWDAGASGLAMTIEALFDQITAEELHDYFVYKKYSYEEYYQERLKAA